MPNLALVTPLQLIVVTSSAPVVMAMAVSDEHAKLIAILASVVAGVVASIAWIDSRVEKGRQRNAALILDVKEDLKEVHRLIHSVEMNGCAQRCTDPHHRRTPVPRFVTDAEK